jgi:hypothetical protein
MMRWHNNSKCAKPVRFQRWNPVNKEWHCLLCDIEDSCDKDGKPSKDGTPRVNKKHFLPCSTILKTRQDNPALKFAEFWTPRKCHWKLMALQPWDGIDFRTIDVALAEAEEKFAHGIRFMANENEAADPLPQVQDDNLIPPDQLGF